MYYELLIGGRCRSKKKAITLKARISCHPLYFTTILSLGEELVGCVVMSSFIANSAVLLCTTCIHAIRTVNWWNEFARSNAPVRSALFGVFAVMLSSGGKKTSSYLDTTLQEWCINIAPLNV